MKRKGFTEVLLIFLTVLVFLSLFTVVMALIYPSAAKNIIADISQSSESSQGGPAGVVGKVVKRAGEGFSARIAPAVRGIGKRLAALFAKKESRVKDADKSGGRPFKAKDCTVCHRHKNLFEQRASNNIYIDHRLHAAADIRCEQCHLDNKHPKPSSIDQEACIACHKKNQASVDCATCHPRGSILDSAVIPKEMTEEFLHNRTAATKSLTPHNFGAPDPSWLKGQGDPPCRNCHDVPEFCNKCHLVFHTKIPDWKQVHGPRILRQEYVMNVCWTCHNATWCAGNCHVNPGATRSGQYLELPKVPLEAYIR